MRQQRISQTLPIVGVAFDNSAFVSYILVMMKFGELIDRYLNLRPRPHVSRYV